MINWLSVFSAKTADYFWMRDAAQNRKYSAYASIDRPVEYTRESLIHMYMPGACSSWKCFHWYRELNRVFYRVPIIWILIKKKNRRDSNGSKELILPFCSACFYQTARFMWKNKQRGKQKYVIFFPILWNIEATRVFDLSFINSWK